jgi:hypothetical protein
MQTVSMWSGRGRRYVSLTLCHQRIARMSSVSASADRIIRLYVFGVAEFSSKHRLGVVSLCLDVGI